MALRLTAVFVFASVILAQPSAPDITGEWSGVVGGRVRFVFRIEKTDDALKAVLEVPDQGNVRIPVSEMSFDGVKTLRFNLKNLNATYDGELSADRSEITGLFQQGPTRVPLVLRRPGADPLKALQGMTRGRVALKPCLAPDRATAGLCGSYEVFENRASRTGRKIALNILVLPARSAKPEPDPVFAFAGGPGQGAVKAFPMATYVVEMRSRRDIVLIDQRGTGESNPLRCAFDPNDAQVLIGAAYSSEGLAACRVELEKRADLTQYTTSAFADDVDEIRQALGYDKIDVIGGSYGSLSSLVYLRRHEKNVRAVAIEGVAPPDYRMPLPFAKTIQSALERLFDDCAADPACHKSFPELKAEVEEIVNRLDKEPAVFDFKSPGAAQAQQVTLTRGAFISGMRPLLYQPAVVSQLPYLLHQAHENNWNPYATIAIATHRAVGEEVARGLAFSVNCAESVPFITEDDVKRETEGTYLRDFDVRNYQRNCSVWPHGEVTKEYLAPVRSDVPVLLISGALDPATPPRLAAHAAEELKNGRVVAIPNGTHLTASACIDRILVQFLDAGSVAGIDTSCVNEIRNPPFRH